MTKKFALEILRLSHYIPVPQEDIDKATLFLTKLYKQLPVIEGKSVEIMYDNLYRKLTSALIPDLNECEIHVLSILLTRLELDDNLKPKEKSILEAYQNL